MSRPSRGRLARLRERFAGYILRFDRWRNRTGDVRLNAGETIVLDSFAWWLPGGIGRRGRFVLTSQRVIFLGDAPRFVGDGQVMLSMSADEISDVRVVEGVAWRAAMPFLQVVAFTYRCEEMRFQATEDVVVSLGRRSSCPG